MNIAICDDNIYDSSHLESLVDMAFYGNTRDYDCEVFSTGDSLLEYLNKNPLAFQIYLLDIEMDGKDGVQTAREIRAQDGDAIIIFVTNHAELMSQAFKVLAFQYIVKPFEDESAIEIILSALNLLQSRKSLFQYSVRKKTCTLYQSQIEYIESIGRKILLHTVGGEVQEYYGTLKDAAAKTAGLSFAQIHSSYIINMEQLETVDAQGVRLRSGTHLTISDKYRRSFNDSWRSFILARTK